MRTKIIKYFFIALCIIQLFYIFYYRSGFKYEILKNPFKYNSGINYALTKEVIETKNIIEETRIKNFYFSKKLKEDTYFYQRSVEYNYPVRIDTSSKFIFFHLEEKVPDNCNIIKNGNYIKLIQC